jgi:uncharacterized membrane protein
MLSDVFRRSLTLAHQRAGLVFIDALWKAGWIILTTLAFLLAAWWTASDILAINWEDTRIRALNALIALTLLRDFWNTNRIEIIVTVLTILLFSAAGWIFLEAHFRRKIVQDLCQAAGHRSVRVQAKSELKRADRFGLQVFLASGIFKFGFFFMSVFLIALVYMAGAHVLAVIFFLGLAFLLTLLDSVIRADAIDLLGTDLFRVAGLLGILMLFELMIGTSVVILLVTGVFRIERSSDAVVMLGGVLAAGVFLSLLHSYLLLVRFCAIVIMRQNVVEV